MYLPQNSNNFYLKILISFKWNSLTPNQIQSKGDHKLRCQLLHVWERSNHSRTYDRKHVQYVIPSTMKRARELVSANAFKHITNSLALAPKK